jgi:hypothetical protein
MSMTDYLGEIEYAVTETLNSLWRDRAALDLLAADLLRLEAATRAGYRHAASVAADPFDDDDGLATMSFWETYFGPDKEHHANAQERDEVEARRAARAFSSGALGTALLQYAKQGVSVVHGGLATCPDGRLIGSQAMKDVVWQGRNQATHWEDGRLSDPVVNCFETLRLEIDQKFGDYARRNLSFEVIELLGWRSFNDFSSDLLLLA